MAKETNEKSINERVRDALEQLGNALGEWLGGRRPQPQPIPIPVDRRPQYGRRQRRQN
ncbi:MAG TPA: hypothetical protein PKE64_06125 [Anaerolineae bacterium]|nr:hypothetical protein [Anaerolineae bacterium]HMR63575.1 hypothetical protein [Anaerolineae bacterium]